MTEALGHAPSPANPLHFSPAEWEQLQADDRHGAVVVLGLMTAIFITGLILYTIVLISVL